MSDGGHFEYCSYILILKEYTINVEDIDDSDVTMRIYEENRLKDQKVVSLNPTWKTQWCDLVSDSKKYMKIKLRRITHIQTYNQFTADE